MTIENIINKAPEDCREEFRTFVFTGEASESFCDRLDNDENLQELIDEVIIIMHKELIEIL